MALKQARDDGGSYQGMGSQILYGLWFSDGMKEGKKRPKWVKNGMSNWEDVFAIKWDA